MEDYREIDDSLAEKYSGEVSERKESLAFPFLLVMVGIAIAMLGRLSETMYAEDYLQWMIYFTGIVFFVAGVVKALARKTIYVYMPTQETLQRLELNFDSKEEGRVERTFKSGNFSELYGFRSNCNSCYTLILYGTKSGRVYYTQLTKYEPFDFFAVSDIMRSVGDDALALRSLLCRLKR